MPVMPGVMIPFGSSSKRSGGYEWSFRHFLRTILAVLSKFITLPSFCAEENTSHPMSSSNTSNTSLIWVSAVNTMHRVYVVLASLLPLLLQNSFLESRSLKQQCAVVAL